MIADFNRRCQQIAIHLTARGLMNGWTRRLTQDTAVSICVKLSCERSISLLFDDWGRSPLAPLVVGGNRNISKSPDYPGGGNSLKVPLFKGDARGI